MQRDHQWGCRLTDHRIKEQKKQKGMLLALLLSCVIVVPVLCLIPFPTITEQFTLTVNMTEVFANGTSSVLGFEWIAYNLGHASHIQFSGGQSFNPPWGQLIVGNWFVQYVVDPWTCLNKTVNEQWSRFWAMPTGTQYSGQVVINGKKCNSWTSPGNSSTIYLTLDDVPVAIRILSNQRTFLYFYNDWLPGVPPSSKFQLPGGRLCPQQQQQQQHDFITFPRCTNIEVN